jgi:aryl-alcohol dehydrogenase-like predicted oxidoreductase
MARCASSGRYPQRMRRVLDPRDYGTFGLGCWAIGGPFYESDGRALGWGEVDDAESIRAIHRALELDVRIFDTADVYGAGHSERVLGQALGDRREDVLVVSKFGHVFDESTRRRSRQSCAPDYIRRACEASLARLGRGYIDVLLLHLPDIDDDQVDPAIETLEELVEAGRIRSFGWSTDQPHRIARIAQTPDCSAVEIALNVLDDAPEVVPLLEELQLVAFVRSPLAMGLLAGRITRETRLPQDDIRGIGTGWLEWFHDGRPTPAFMDRLDAVRDILGEDGRSMVEGALGWLWARSPWLIPIPGFRTVAQVEQNAAARGLGPLTADQMARIVAALGR